MNVVAEEHYCLVTIFTGDYPIPIMLDIIMNGVYY